MNEEFEITVSWNNKTFVFTGKLLQYGYTYKIEVDVNGTRMVFERDEERNWRGLIPYEDINTAKPVERGLPEAIAGAIDEILKD